VDASHLEFGRGRRRREDGQPRFSEDRPRGSSGDRDLRYERLLTALQLYRFLLFLCLLVIVVLATVLIAGRRQHIAHAILIDGKFACLVESKAAADRVRQGLLASAPGHSGPVEGAAFREHWSDEDQPVGDNHVLTVAEAEARLRPLLTVVVSATAIAVDGRQAVILADRDTAQKTLEALKARFLKPGEKLIEQRLESRVELVDTQISPQYVFGDVSQAVTQLLRGSVQMVPYTVKRGDTVERVAALYSAPPQELLAQNPGLRRALAVPGKTVQIKLTVPPVQVLTVKEVQQDQPYNLPAEVTPTSSLARGEKRVVSPGQPGQKRVTSKQTWENDKLVTSVVLQTVVVTQPMAAKVLVGQKAGPSLTPAR
jgi:LysM repeat protein